MIRFIARLVMAPSASRLEPLAPFPLAWPARPSRTQSIPPTRTSQRRVARARRDVGRSASASRRTASERTGSRRKSDCSSVRCHHGGVRSSCRRPAGGVVSDRHKTTWGMSDGMSFHDRSSPALRSTSPRRSFFAARRTSVDPRAAQMTNTNRACRTAGCNASGGPWTTTFSFATAS